MRSDATEIQVRGPVAGRGGRSVFVSGKSKQNTMKATVIADDRGRTLWTDGLRPGRMLLGTTARSGVIRRAGPKSSAEAGHYLPPACSAIASASQVVFGQRVS
ncbi:hypothetical protein GCM10015535_66910 [Streptomyces gelaticus]|uniref:Uncharacterized protein n=1 Tax=Streptomyces gelaticus TaxID=285446 RepID=A0ABQ2W8I8_9ACTN|nr:hypothetical protein GCM10015535_66910 [Streptomyces gelaticus]